jgi:hypothetical protein
VGAIRFSASEPPTYTDLREGGSDEIDLQFVSKVVAAI